MVQLSSEEEGIEAISEPKPTSPSLPIPSTDAEIRESPPTLTRY
jgi:hypothetical protein